MKQVSRGLRRPVSKSWRKVARTSPGRSAAGESTGKSSSERNSIILGSILGRTWDSESSGADLGAARGRDLQVGVGTEGADPRRHVAVAAEVLLVHHRAL